MRVRLGVVVMVSLLLSAPWMPGPAEAKKPKEPKPPKGALTPSVVAPDTFGANVRFLDWTNIDRMAHLQKIASEGLTFVRSGIVWDEIQPCRPGTCVEPPRCPCDTQGFWWGRYDQWWADVASAGLRIDPMLGWSAQWASSKPYQNRDLPAPPLLASDYAAYAARVAQHYGRGGDFWTAHPELTAHPVTRYEIWNEENTKWWWDSDITNNGPDPAKFAEVYLAARAAIKAVDPQAIVIVGGLAKVEPDPRDLGLWNLEQGWMVDIDYAKKLLTKPGMSGNVDGLGYHPYGVDAADALRLVRQMRNAIRDVGITDADLPLYINEIGWPYAGGGWWNVPTEAERTSYITTSAEQMTRAPDCNVKAYVVFEWLSPEGTNPNTDPNSFLDWTDIAHLDATLRPSGVAYGQKARALQGTAPIDTPLCPR